MTKPIHFNQTHAGEEKLDERRRLISGLLRVSPKVVGSFPVRVFAIRSV
jgi:hypothetical protein